MENQDRKDQSKKQGQQQPRDDNSVQNQQEQHAGEDMEDNDSDLAGNASGNTGDDNKPAAGK